MAIASPRELHPEWTAEARSPVVREYFKRTLPALYQHLNPLTERESLNKEDELARELRACGYTVIWG